MKATHAIRRGFAKLLSFGGRDTAADFWPYAGVILVLLFAAMAVVMLPEMLATFDRMQRFAAEHPDQATVRRAPGSYSISIEGNHPELMPDFGTLMSGWSVVMAAAVLLLAAAVTRRLHDRGRSGAWALAPLPFLVFAAFAFPKLFEQESLDFGLFGAVFLNNLLYLGVIGLLVLQLVGRGAAGDNRFGPPPAHRPSR
jgi:uncharacterized membrane protein YhaH (DUF805 family)